jgi:hypothetical protein
MESLRKISEYYKTVALIFLGTVILLLLVNIGSFFILQMRNYLYQRENNPVIRKYGDSRIYKVYPDLDEKSVRVLLDETWHREKPFMYEPFVQFKERLYQGKYVNIDANGFRITKNQGPWPPDNKKFNIFMFGGSTTFGYGIPDDQTISSYLQGILSNKLKRDIRVYNFGRAWYYSTQERILFERLLTAGFIPDMVIFVDGLNDSYHLLDEPHFTNQLGQLMDGSEMDYKSVILKKLPMYKFAIYLKQKLFTGKVEKKEDNKRSIQKDINPEALPVTVINRYLTNKKIIEAICDRYKIQPIFVWQPVPTYKYDLNYHSFSYEGEDLERIYRINKVYKYFAEYTKRPKEINFFWCADMQEELKEPLYIDNTHYSAKMSEMFASYIANLLIERNLLKK